MTAPDQKNTDPEPHAGQGKDIEKPADDGVFGQEPAEGGDDVNPPQPGSPRG
jgi:hypothetical protein